MKYQFKIGNQTFDVEIADLHSQPAIVIVNGETIEVWKETSPGANIKAEKPRPGAQTPDKAALPTKLTRPEVDNETKGDSLSVSAPIPGVIVAVTVHEGDNVEPGDELCVLEAMKMKNSIRSPRAGKIGRVLIHLNQTVKHRDTLLEFSE